MTFSIQKNPTFHTLQEYSRLWVEVNFTVSAYDELKMCKSRTQAVDPVELQDESVMESNLIISKYEVGIQNKCAHLHICMLVFQFVCVYMCGFSVLI